MIRRKGGKGRRRTGRAGGMNGEEKEGEGMLFFIAWVCVLVCERGEAKVKGKERRGKEVEDGDEQETGIPLSAQTHYLPPPPRMEAYVTILGDILFKHNVSIFHLNRSIAFIECAYQYCISHHLSQPELTIHKAKPPLY